MNPGIETGLNQKARAQPVRTRFEVLVWTGVGVLILLALALVVHRIFFSPSGILVVQDEHAPWIMVHGPIDAEVSVPELVRAQGLMSENALRRLLDPGRLTRPDPKLAKKK